MFGVNTFIVSQVNPHGIPFIWDHSCPENASIPRRLYAKLKRALYEELSHYIKFFSNFMNYYIVSMQTISEQTMRGHVIIVPDIMPSDYQTVFKNVDEE